MRIEVKDNLKELTRGLNRIQRQQIPFAASQTLNQLAYELAKKVMPEKADKTFEGGATAFTKKGFGYQKSSKRNLVATVFINEAQKKYLQFMVQGGTRFPNKKAILVSTKQSKLNKYGNFPKGKVSQMLTDKAKFFSGKPKGQSDKPAGIWERYGRGSKGGGQRIRLVALYTDQAEYRPIFPFGNFGMTYVFSRNDGFAAKFRKNLERALSSAK